MSSTSVILTMMCQHCAVKSKLQAGNVKHVHFIGFGSEELVHTKIPSLNNPVSMGHGLKFVLQLKENKGKR